MADNMDENIKKAKAYNDSLNAINKSLETQASRIGTLTSEMGIAFGTWQSQTKKTQQDRLEEIKLIDGATKSVKTQSDIVQSLISNELKLGDAFKKNKTRAEQFSSILSSMDASELSAQFSNISDIQKKIYELEKEKGELGKGQKSELEKLQLIAQEYQKETRDFNEENEKHFEKWLETNTEVQDIFENLPEKLSSTADKMEFIKNLQEKGADEAERLVAAGIITGEAADKILSQTQKLVEMRTTLSDLQAESANQMKAETNLFKQLVNVAKANSENAFNSIISKVKEIDQSLKDAQRDFGMSFDGAYIQMAGLTSEAARFGMFTKDTVEMMGQLGDELKTTDTKYLASATGHFIAIQKATGISSEEVTTIAGEMMRAGRSAEEVEGFMDSSNKIAKKFGVNTKKVLQGVSKNIDKMRQMGFQGGEESLARMAARAERLNMNMDEIFDVAKKARNIEGAMEMASELQLAGGSFANINPMDLLAAARKGPEELQKILTQMGGDIGDFNKETGELKFDAIDSDRLQMVADATGQSVDSIQKMLQKTAQDNQKLDLLGLDSSVGEDAKNFLADMTTMKDGELSVSPELSDLASSAGIEISNVDDLKNLSKEETEKLLAEKVNKEKSLEEQALANQSFSESMTAFKESVMSLFTVFEPVLNLFTKMIQGLASFGPVGQILGAALVGFVAFGPKIIGAFGSFKDGVSGMIDSFKGFKEKGIKGIFTGATKSPTEGALPGADSKDTTPKSGGGLSTLAEGLKAMGDPKVFAGIGAIALAGPALLIFTPAIPGLLVLAGVGALSKLILSGFQTISEGFGIMGNNIKNILLGSAAIAVAGLALLPFTYSMGMMASIDWGSALAGVGTLALVMLGLVGVGYLAMNPAFALGLLLAVGTLALVGPALSLFGKSMEVFASSSEKMKNASFDWIGSLGWNLLLAAPGLILGAGALMLAAPALLIGSMAMIPMMSVLEKASTINWSSFAAMSSALYTISGALLAFGAASMAGGIMGAIGGLLGGGGPLETLETLANLSVEAAEPLMMMSEAVDGLANGLEKLSAASASLDMEKLDMLRELAWSMAIGAVGGGIMGDSIDKIAEALMKMTKSGEGGSGGGAKKIEINLKLNGRDLQRIIYDDTSIVS